MTMLNVGASGKTSMIARMRARSDSRTSLPSSHASYGASRSHTSIESSTSGTQNGCGPVGWRPSLCFSANHALRSFQNLLCCIDPSSVRDSCSAGPVFTISARARARSAAARRRPALRLPARDSRLDEAHGELFARRDRRVAVRPSVARIAPGRVGLAAEVLAQRAIATGLRGDARIIGSG